MIILVVARAATALTVFIALDKEIDARFHVLFPIHALSTKALLFLVNLYVAPSTCTYFIGQQLGHRLDALV